MASREKLIIGVGEEFRGDDGVGIAVARTIERAGWKNVCVRISGGDGITLSHLWEGYEEVVLVDASASGRPPGSIARLDGNDATFLHSRRRTSTHAFAVPDAIELSRTIGTLPRRVVIYCIEGNDYSMGADLSPAVSHAADEVVRMIHDEVSGE